MTPCHITVEVDKVGSFEAAVRRFRKRVERTGLLSDIMKYNHYVKPSDKRRAKKQERERMKKIQELKAKGGRSAH